MYCGPYYAHWITDLPLAIGAAILLDIVAVLVVVVISVVLLVPDDVDCNDDVGIDADSDVALVVVLVERTGVTHTSDILKYTGYSSANHHIGTSRQSISFT